MKILTTSTATIMDMVAMDMEDMDMEAKEDMDMEDMEDTEDMVAMEAVEGTEGTDLVLMKLRIRYRLLPRLMSGVLAALVLLV